MSWKTFHFTALAQRTPPVSYECQTMIGGFRVHQPQVSSQWAGSSSLLPDVSRFTHLEDTSRSDKMRLDWRQSFLWQLVTGSCLTFALVASAPQATITSAMDTLARNPSEGANSPSKGRHENAILPNGGEQPGLGDGKKLTDDTADILAETVDVVLGNVAEASVASNDSNSMDKPEIKGGRNQTQESFQSVVNSLLKSLLCQTLYKRMENLLLDPGKQSLDKHQIIESAVKNYQKQTRHVDSDDHNVHHRKSYPRNFSNLAGKSGHIYRASALACKLTCKFSAWKMLPSWQPTPTSKT